MINLKKMVLGLLCVTAVGAGLGVAEAGPAHHEHHYVKRPAIARPPVQQTQKEIVALTGSIVNVDKNQVTIRTERGTLVTGLVNKKTDIVNGKTGERIYQYDLKKGQRVTLYHSPVMTRSYPGQTKAYAIVVGREGSKQGKYFKVGKVIEGQKTVKLVNNDGDLVVTVKKSDIWGQKIKKGSQLLLWYDQVTMSMPGQAFAKKAKVI